MGPGAEREIGKMAAALEALILTFTGNYPDC